MKVDSDKLIIRVTPEQHEKVFRIAEARGQTMTAFVRDWIDSLNYMSTPPSIDEIIETVTPIVKQHDALTHVWLFGSYARGDSESTSDVDFAYDYDVKASSFPWYESLQLQDELLDALRSFGISNVDLILNPEKSVPNQRFRANFERDRILIYEK